MPYPDERVNLNYEVPASGSTPGSLVVATLDYYPYTNGNPPREYYEVDVVSGTYEKIDSSGNVISQDQITGFSSALGGDNYLYIFNSPYVDQNGISFKIDNKADSDDGMGNVNFYYGTDGNGGEGYHEQGSNENDAQNVLLNNYGLANYNPCFTGGTLIRTVDGDVAVEHLAVGDLVVTASGALRPIRWLGHRATRCAGHPEPANVNPVRIAAHAFGSNRPARDLVVSPGHAICLDIAGEVLVPAMVLVDGKTVVQERVDTVTYWHVELDCHDILLAENLPAESYLEMGNRSFFAEAEAVVLHAKPDAPIATHTDFCRPYVDVGPRVEAARAVLRERQAITAQAYRRGVETFRK